MKLLNTAAMIATLVSMQTTGASAGTIEGNVTGMFNSADVLDEGYNSYVYVDQAGMWNDAAIGIEGCENEVVSAQTGYGNEFDALIQGVGNQVYSDQTGYGNATGVWIEGQGNFFSVSTSN